MKDKDIVEKGVKLAEEIITLTQKKENEDIKQEDYPNMNDCISSNKYIHELIKTLSKEKGFTHTEKEKRENIEKMLSLLKRKNLLMRLKRTVIASSSVAAAIVLFLLTMTDNKKSENKVITQTIIDNKPQLILGNGDKINLTQMTKIKGYKIDTTNNIISYHTSYNNKDTTEYNTIIIPNRFTCDVVLEDGTVVKLNANSELRYPTKFSNNKREVFLKGEGYFEVTKNETPFIISSEGMTVRVYGTKFNINAGKNSIFETTLLSGSIGVIINNKVEVMMRPNQLFSLNTRNGNYSIQDVDPSNYVTWMSDYITQKGTLNMFLEKITNWYGVEFSFDADIDMNMNVIISLSKKLSIDEFLKIVGNSLNIAFEKETNNKYIVHNSKQMPMTKTN